MSQLFYRQGDPHLSGGVLTILVDSTLKVRVPFSRLVTIMRLLSPKTNGKHLRQFKLKTFDKPKLTFKKFCLFFFFAAFATHLVYLGELTQIKYTAVRNKSIHYSQYVEEYLHSKNRSEVVRNRTQVMRYYYPKVKKETMVTKVILISSNPRSGSSYVGEVLSAMPGVSYFFEPLWLMAKPNKSLEEPIHKVRLKCDRNVTIVVTEIDLSFVIHSLTNLF